jgi:hypothetical protein
MNQVKWTPERHQYIHSQRASGKRMVEIAQDLGETEGSVRKAFYASNMRNKPVTDPEDLFSYEDVEMITGLPVKTIHFLIKEHQLKGNGKVERRELVNFVLRFPGSCERGDIVQIIYLLGGDRCSPNLK